MPNLKSRLDALEASREMHIAKARETGRLGTLTDAELGQLIAELDSEIGPEQAERIRTASDAELAAIARGEM